MEDGFTFDLVSPERKLASVAATEVSIPGANGDMTTMQNHTALMTVLRPGVLSFTASGVKTEYVVSGGFVEVNDAGITVLAESAIEKADLTREMLDQIIEETRSQLEDADDKDAIKKRIADFEAIEI